MIELREYVDIRGHSLYRDWLVLLDTATISRVIAAVKAATSPQQSL
jgi:hypothetical protein